MNGTLSVLGMDATKMATTTVMTPIAHAVWRVVGSTVGCTKWEAGFMITIIRFGSGGLIAISILSEKALRRAENTKMPDMFSIRHSRALIDFRD
jgi:hypothetical protein